MNIIFFGDSICYGEKINPHKIFVSRLADYVCREISSGFTIINASINGNTTRMALERMPFDVQRSGLGLMVLQFGLNDCNCWQTDNGLPRVSPEGFIANLHEIIDRAIYFGARKVILNTNHPTSRNVPFPHTGKPYQEGNARYNNLIRSVAGDPRRKDDTVLADIEKEILAGIEQRKYSLESLLFDDGLHLSEQGHEVYFEILKPVLNRECHQILA